MVVDHTQPTSPGRPIKNAEVSGMVLMESCRDTSQALQGQREAAMPGRKERLTFVKCLSPSLSHKP